MYFKVAGVEINIDIYLGNVLPVASRLNSKVKGAASIDLLHGRQ